MSSIIININEKIAKWIAEHNLQIEDVFVLKVFSTEDQTVLQEYLTFKTSDQKLVYFQSLVRKGMLEMLVDVDEFSWDNYNLTEEAKKIITYLDGVEVTKDVELVNITSKDTSDIGIIDSKVILDQEKQTEFDKFIEEFRSKWPEGRNGGGVSFKGNKIDVTNKMVKFMNKYKFDKHTILTATDLYLTSFRRKGFEFCQAAEYFIMKNQSSTLAGYCEMVLKNVTTGSSANPFEQTM